MDKWIEKFMESKWFVRIIALVLALLLYLTAYIDDKGPNTLAKNNQQELIENVPVELVYDEEIFVVTGAPETVDVYVEGNNSLVQSAKNLRNFTVYLDLTDAKIGRQRVEIQIRDISERLKVRIDPKYAYVNVQEKITKEFSVEVELNKGMLEEGYTAEQPVVTPATVEVTGGKDIIEQIGYVKAIIEADKLINETLTFRAHVLALDKDMNKLNVQIDPARVTVTIPVVSPKKTVPIVIKQEGRPKEGLYIQNIEPLINEVVIFGKQSVLDEITSIEIPVDVTDIDKNTEITIPIRLAQGVHSVTPESVTVKITIDREETKTINDIPIEVSGLEEGYDLRFISPDEGLVSLTVTGPSGTIKNVNMEDFKLLIRTSGLDEGEHEVEIEVDGPDNLKWQLKTETAAVEIRQKES